MPNSQPSHRPRAQTVETPIRAEAFRAALQPRTLGLAGLDEARNVRAIHLERGEARLRLAGDEVVPLQAPVMGWFPWHPDMRLEIGAGAQGSHLLVGRAPLDRALARSPESADLRFMPERRVVLHLSRDDGAATSIAASFAGILAETLRPGQMSATVVEAFLRILLVLLFRGQTQEAPTGLATGGGGALASRFTTLVEGHLREHWPVSRYAVTLGISRDRLNDICLRVHDRPPGQLIRERLQLEARIHLEQSALSIEQIAGALGFNGAPQFNRFFRSMNGLPPGQYRARQRALAETGAPRSATLYNWP